MPHMQDTDKNLRGVWRAYLAITPSGSPTVTLRGNFSCCRSRLLGNFAGNFSNGPMVSGCSRRTRSPSIRRMSVVGMNSGKHLLALSFSEFDPQETSASIWREWVSPYRLIA